MDLISENCLGSLYTNGSIGNLLLYLKGRTFSFRFCEFINVRKRLNNMDWESILLNTNSFDDLHEISLTIKGDGALLSLEEAIQLWELLNSAHYIFSLNDLLNRNGMATAHKLPLSLTTAAQLSEI